MNAGWFFYSDMEKSREDAEQQQQHSEVTKSSQDTEQQQQQQHSEATKSQEDTEQQQHQQHSEATKCSLSLSVCLSLFMCYNMSL